MRRRPASALEGEREFTFKHALTRDVAFSNLETPCPRSPRSLLVMAVAEQVRGDEARARSLERLADEFAMEGYGHLLSTPRVRLALLRDDLASVERLVAEPLPDRGWHRGWMLLATESARLDALAALGRRAERPQARASLRV